MKLPAFNLNFFKKSKSTKKRVTNFGSSKRRSSAASVSTRKSRRSSTSGRHKSSRKRSITYYSPSKSKFYPTEYFPSLQRIATQVTAAATPLAANLFHRTDTIQTASIDATDASNFSPPGTIRSYTKQTYLCDDDQKIVIHEQPFQSHDTTTWYMQSRQPQDIIRYQPTNDMLDVNTKQPSTFIDANGNVSTNNSYTLSNGNAYLSTTTYPKECKQGVPASMPYAMTVNTLNSIPYIDPTIKLSAEQQSRQSQHNLLPSNLTAMNSYNAVYPTHTMHSAKNFSVSNATSTMPHTNPSFMSFHGATTIPMAKKSERHHRRRKVCFSRLC